MGRLTPWLAFRFLKSKKSHGAISAIASVSVGGIAIATAAVICVLSVFNGFREVLEDKFDSMTSDIVVTPAKGKVILNADSLAEAIQSIAGVKNVAPVVSDKALAIYGGKELPVTIRGVDPLAMNENTAIRDMLLPGGKMPEDRYEEMPEFEYYEDYEAYIANTPKPEALPSIGAAIRLGNMAEGDDFLLFAPKREGRYNPANPSSSFITDSVKISGIFETKQKEYDEDMVIVPIGLARHLFQYDGEATSLEINADSPPNIRRIKEEIKKNAGNSYTVKDRKELQEVNFRMVNIEKWVSFLLLVFILMIAGFNIISTMTMLVLEKREQISLMNAVGFPKRKIGSVFAYESIMVSITGGAAGLVLGIILCLLQQEYGLIKLSGDPSKLLLSSYPVKLIWSDIGLAFVPCVVLGIITAFIASSFARQRIKAVASE